MLVRSIIALSLVGTAFGCQKGSKSTPKSLIPGVTGEGLALGMGYDSLTRKATGIQCFAGIKGEPEFKGGTANLEVLSDVDRSKLQRIMDGEVELRIPVYPGIRAVGTAAFASEYAKNDYSQNFVVNFQAITERSRVTLPADTSVIKKSPELQRISTFEDSTLATELMQEACGDEYVVYWEKGVAFSAVLSIEYSNEYDLKRFSGTLSAEVLSLDIPLELRASYENMKKYSQARAKLVIQQRGGSPEKMLGEILQDPDATKSNEFFLQCNSETIEDCTGVFKRVVNYLKNIQTQIKDDTGKDLGQGVPLLVESAPYPNESPFNILYGNLTQPEIDTRKADSAAGAKEVSAVQESLNTELGSTLADQDRLVTLDRRMGSSVKEQIKGKLADLKQKIDFYAAELKALSAQCTMRKFDKNKIKECVAKVNELKAKKPYTNDELKIGPKTFTEWCPLAFDSTALINEGDYFAVLAMVEAVKGDVGLSNEELVKSCNSFAFELAKLNSLDLSNATHPVSSLTPLGTLPGLQTIIARNQIIGSVDGLENTQIQELDLTGNQFSSLSSITKLKSAVLRRIILKNNLLTSLETGDSSIEASELDVSGNSIKQIQNFRSTKLSRLVLDGNPIESMGFLAGIVVPKPAIFSLKRTGTTVCPSADFTCEF